MDPIPKLPEASRRAVAGFLLHAYVSGRKLPEHVPGIPDSQIVDRLMRQDAKEMLETLRDLYGVKWWTREAFQRAFVDGALQGWKPGSLVREDKRGLRVLSSACPVAADVERDPRVCDACQALQRHAAYLALFGQVEGVVFDQLMREGDGACEMRIGLRARSPAGSSRGPPVSDAQLASVA